jgi:hypothetical protein
MSLCRDEAVPMAASPTPNLHMITPGDQAMNVIRTIALGAMALMVATAASAQTRSSPTPSASQVMGAPANPQRNESRPLFTIGGLEVHVWAPRERPYDAHMNQTAAADPMWEAGE